MEDAIDLRDYLDVLVRRGKWIAGAMLIAVVVAGVFSFAVAPT